MTSRISTLCSGRYMQVIKSLGHHLSGRWSRCTGGCYIEMFGLKTYGRIITWSLRTGGYFKKVVAKTGLTVLVFRKPLTSRGKLPFSQNLSQVAGREETMKSLILLNMCYYNPLFVKLWMFPLNSRFLLVRKRRNCPFY